MNTASSSFQDLIVWQKSHQLVLSIYRLTKDFPHEEMYGLVSQIRGSCVSVPANIAEGYAKLGVKDKIRFFNIGQGSLEETKYYLILARDLHYSDTTKLLQLAEEVSRILTAYIKSVSKKKP